MQTVNISAVHLLDLLLLLIELFSTNSLQLCSSSFINLNCMQNAVEVYIKQRLFKSLLLITKYSPCEMKWCLQVWCTQSIFKVDVLRYINENTCHWLSSVNRYNCVFGGGWTNIPWMYVTYRPPVHTIEHTQVTISRKLFRLVSHFNKISDRSFYILLQQ